MQVAHSRFLKTGLILLCLSLAIPSLAKEAKPFINAEKLDIRQVIGAPPANDSPDTRAELATLEALQNKRTTRDEARILADTREKVWRFAEVLGTHFNARSLPKTKSFFKRVVATSRAVVAPAKQYWMRPRPFTVDDKLIPSIKHPTSGSWPSRHATTGTLFGLILADMIPEKREALLERAKEFADNRAFGGVHYPSDIEAGRRTAAAIIVKLKEDSNFVKAFNDARDELRKKLHLDEASLETSQ